MSLTKKQQRIQKYMYYTGNIKMKCDYCENEQWFRPAQITRSNQIICHQCGNHLWIPANKINKNALIKVSDGCKNAKLKEIKKGRRAKV
jgi:ribosomal protein S27E